MKRTSALLVLTIVACGKKEATTDVKPAEPMSPEYQKLSTECEQGTVDSCNKLGRAIMKGREGAPKDKAVARALFTRACEALHDKLTCGDHAVRYEEGQFPEVGSDLALALKYESMACGLGDKNSCSAEAFAYLQGKGVAKDADKARQLFDTACDKDTQLACYQLMKSVQDGTFPPKGERDIAYYRKRACSLGVPDACDDKK